MVTLRNYHSEDTPQLIELFRDTVHTVCSKDYSPAQLKAWAPKTIDEASWKARLGKSFTLVALYQNEIVGFSSLEKNGNVDMFYVHASHQGLKVGRMMMEALKAQAQKQGNSILTSDVSLTARAFFLRQGFEIRSEYIKVLRGETFQNALMEMKLK